ncbi:MAG TPA: nuclear transport factor 2 family protein [Chthoniobacterales bacterium]|jgi:hypothetical protein|nr:nuclear transport factor 2 family protein [Chthoniobacterales bacterium]
MKKLICYTIVAFFATIAVSIAAPDKAAIEAKEKAAWQAFKEKKSDEFKKLLSPNFMAVYSDGIQTKQKEIDSMQKWDLKSFSFSDFNLVMTDPDTALVTYQVKMEGTYDGKDMSGDYNCGSIWQMKKGEWHPIFHTNMKQEKPAATQ